MSITKYFLFLFTFLSFNSHSVELPPLQCLKDVKSIANDWGAKEWKNRINKNFIAPTNTFGDWVIVRDFKKAVTITKENENRSIIIAIDKKNCQREMKVIQKKRSRLSLKKTDQDLKRFVSESRGVFYFISPSMPLSVKGIKPAFAAAKEMGVKFYPVLDPAVKKKDMGLAHQIAVENGLAEIHQFDSFEFRMRNVYIHYPTLIGFKDGKILDVKKYGYEDNFLEDIKLVLK